MCNVASAQEKNTPDSIFARIEKSAIRGDAVAQYNLGMMYLNGDGVRMDDAKAVYWLTKAAEKGDSRAQFNLGWFYANGSLNIPPDYKEARKWFQMAHDNGEPDAGDYLKWLPRK